MKLFRKPTTMELAVELIRTVNEKQLHRRFSLVAHWRRARFERHFGQADYAEVLRAYYALRAYTSGEIVALRRPQKRRLAA